MLRRPLTGDQLRLLGVIYEPFHNSGEWPFWQFVDLTMQRRFGVNACEVLASLPRAGDASRGYGLTWRPDPMIAPQPHHEVALTAAGLCHVPEAGRLLELFSLFLQAMATAVTGVVPVPRQVVEAEISSDVITEIARGDRGISREVNDLQPLGLGLQITQRKVRLLLEHEPVAFIVHRPDASQEQWTVRIPAALRGLGGAVTIDGYLDWLIVTVVPDQFPPTPASAGPLDVATAVGYLDAVWKAKTGSRLFASPDVLSVARLTLMCRSEEEFNSLMSALADVLGQVVSPGVKVPPQREALERARDWLVPQVDPDVADRLAAAFGTLIILRHLRVSQQHSDARHKAVAAFRDIGLTFPPPSWDMAWTRIVALARGALDVIREEVSAALADK